jgi:putative peptidoglycan lipid II flippase
LKGALTQGNPQGMQPLWVLWLFGYAYAFVIALVLQKLVMPIMPGLHAGHGLMNHDAIVFHDAAAAMADRIIASGWSEWHLFPGPGLGANVGILAAIYAVLGPDPVWFIPLNAGFHALGALLILRLGLFIMPGKRGMLAGGGVALLFLAFPSALVWYGQNHKDAFLIAGYLMTLIAFVRALGRGTLVDVRSDLILISLGCLLVAVMRPHMLIVYTVAFTTAWFGIAVWRFIRPSQANILTIRNATVMLGVVITATLMAPKGNDLVVFDLENFDSTSTSAFARTPATEIGWHWVHSEILPSVIDRKLERISFIRAHFIATGRSVGAGSIIDGNVVPVNAFEVVEYLPRALWVGLFAPFPDTWTERPTVPRLIGALETLVFYLMAPGVLIILFRRPSIPLFVCLTVSAVVLAILSYTSPNVGTLHRIRYGPLFIFMLAGALGWSWLLGKAVHLLSTRHTGHYVATSSLPNSEQATVFIANLSGKRAIGSGVVVTLISMIGALGLLIRDLLLINRSGFGASLDSFYLAMMVPMLFVNILSIPLGDALTSALHRMKGQENVQSLLRATSGASLVVFSMLGLVLFILSGPIYRNFVASGNIEEVVMLMPIALLLFLFSGLVVTGNSLLNALEKPALAASAQLVVPLIAVVALIFAPENKLILLATIGMVAGQVLNMVILYVIASRQGYFILPGSFVMIGRVRSMLSNYAWLVVAALLMSLSIPFNYWLAGQLGAGAVSIWAVGSKLVQIATGLGVALMSAVWVPYFSKMVTARLHLRIRNEVYLSLLVGSWGGGIVSLIIFGFAAPMVTMAMPAVQDELRINQLAGVIELGALQLPFLVSGLMLIKLCAVSEVSWKVVMATLAGFVANVVLGYAWLPIWGLLGIAAAWCVAAFLSALVIIFATRAESFLGWSELFSIFATWLVIGAVVLATHVKNLSVTTGALMLFLLLVFGQVNTLLKKRDSAETVSG